MNKPEAMCDLRELYALGGLDDQERKEFEQHLKGCVECKSALAELAEIIDLLPLAAEPVEVPEGMKERILGRVLGEQTSIEQRVNRITDTSSSAASLPLSVEITKRRAVESTSRSGGRWRPWLYGGLSAAILVLGVYSYDLKEQNTYLKAQLVALNQPAEGARTGSVVSLNSTAADIVAKGLATIVIDTKGTHLLVQAEKLPELKGNEAFQVWLLKGKDVVVNAGTFMSHDGTGGLYFTMEPSSYDQIAITLEPDAYGDKPRGKPVLAASLGKS
ncbi:anti-sigma factor [Paenibacillus hexagrammi]|uniref:Anti-sigma-W factor RsiW n=1 Tax=Paenibacillus hexagrammi TaxID=2908839 RepID=A0ABY3SG54_9BACL|nr:anti-sigma factor [Paenibacillus sp. YPD9-1]UJF32420.1 anti-sigma factor [Paenibacillus sp. YPD9-1]